MNHYETNNTSVPLTPADVVPMLMVAGNGREKSKKVVCALRLQSTFRSNETAILTKRTNTMNAMRENNVVYATRMQSILLLNETSVLTKVTILPAGESKIPS